MIALGRALAARGHDVTFETWRRWQGGRRTRGDALRAGARYPVFPLGAGAPRLLRRSGASRRERRARRANSTRKRSSLTSSRSRRRSRPRCTGSAGRRWCRTCCPTAKRISYRLLPGARLPATAAGRALWRSPRPGDAARSSGVSSSTLCGAISGWRRSSGRTAASVTSWSSSRRCHSSSIRGCPNRTST